MIWQHCMQNQQYLQRFWSLAYKHSNIYNDLGARHVKTTIFTMIWKPAMQKRLQLQWFGSLACENNTIYNDFEAWHANTTAFAMILKPGKQKRQHLQWFWSLTQVVQNFVPVMTSRRPYHVPKFDKPSNTFANQLCKTNNPPTLFLTSSCATASFVWNRVPGLHETQKYTETFRTNLTRTMEKHSCARKWCF